MGKEAVPGDGNFEIVFSVFCVKLFTFIKLTLRALVLLHLSLPASSTLAHTRHWIPRISLDLINGEIVHRLQCVQVINAQDRASSPFLPMLRIQDSDLVDFVLALV